MYVHMLTGTLTKLHSLMHTVKIGKYADACMHTETYTHMHTHTHTHLPAFDTHLPDFDTHMHTHMHTHKHTCTHTHMHARTLTSP